MPRTLLGELQRSFACSLSVTIHFCLMVLEIALSMGCFLVPVSHEVGASQHPSVAGHLSGAIGRCGGRGGEGFVVPWNTTCPMSRLFRLSYVCRVIHVRSLPCCFPETAGLCSAAMVLRLKQGLHANSLNWLSYNVMCRAEENLTAVMGKATHSETTDHWYDSPIL